LGCALRGWCIARWQQLVCAQQQRFAGGGQQTVSADVVKAGWEHVLQESLQERKGGQRLVHGLSGAVALETKGNVSVLEMFEPAVG
jgi:hypothetical protein